MLKICDTYLKENGGFRNTEFAKQDGMKETIIIIIHIYLHDRRMKNRKARYRKTRFTVKITITLNMNHILRETHKLPKAV